MRIVDQVVGVYDLKVETIAQACKLIGNSIAKKVGLCHNHLGSYVEIENAIKI